MICNKCNIKYQIDEEDKEILENISLLCDSCASQVDISKNKKNIKISDMKIKEYLKENFTRDTKIKIGDRWNLLRRHKLYELYFQEDYIKEEFMKLYDKDIVGMLNIMFRNDTINQILED